ncbi:MAG: hypothetical protein U1B30_09740 [Pseudomonadota bacterium]|nr:hypothetical protein [Pseudomonadota bacterium]
MNEKESELLERQLAEKITNRLRQDLFRFYAAIGTAVIVTLGLVGYDILSNVEGDIRAEILKSIDDDIKQDKEEISQLALESKLLARHVGNTIKELDKKLKDFEPQADQLDETINKLNETVNKVDSISIAARDAVSIYSSEVKPLVENFTVVSNQLKELAKQVTQLNALAEGGGTKLPAVQIDSVEVRGEAITSVIAKTEDVEQKFRERDKVTVFFQFAGAPREQALELSAKLKQKGYSVPGEDREAGAARKHEVRYFHEQDEVAAKKLAADTDSALKNLGYTTSSLASIEPMSFVSYKGKKPREGVIELWIELPKLVR